jgi:hypothetical protein
MGDVTITPFLGPSDPASDSHGIPPPFLVSLRVPAGDYHGPIHALPISSLAIALILFITTHPNNTI